MLQIVLTPYLTPVISNESPPNNGPFVVRSRTPEETVFTANAQYFEAEAAGLKELVERRFPSFAEAVLALRRGEIQVLDRVNPWKLASLQADSSLIVEPYALPLVHCLIPNVRRPLLKDRTFRRALVYGIHRHAILRQILGAKDVHGCKVTSSPFLLPVGIDDPMGYASNENIEPWPYDPRLAIALANVALDNLAATEKQRDIKAASIPKLVLAYPAHEIAHTACLSIRKQLELLDIPIELRPLENPLPTHIPDDVDLLYAELAMWEPVVDARRVLGESGIGGGCSPYMSHALRQLDEAADWRQVRDCLHRIHRMAHDDVAVIPLWQLVEHFACREGFRGITANPVSLYQNVEQWRPAFLDPAEE
jgi:ABC-type transport system substrate-binding protein